MTGDTIDPVRFLTRSIVRTLPVVLTLALASVPVAQCFAPPPGAEMPCCASMHHDEACGQAGSAARCCTLAQMQASFGVTAAKHQEAAASLIAVVSSVVALPSLSQVPDFLPQMFDTGPPGRSTRLHIVLSVFLV